jgi:hypothetical protein
MVAISGRMRSQRLGRWARLSSCLSLSFADALSAKTASVGRPFACVVSSTSVLPPDFRPLPHAGIERYVWHKWLQQASALKRCFSARNTDWMCTFKTRGILTSKTSYER